jgi:2,4-dienoyl-CoA reductase-like NADH-dependent reductase (Old Yellow Enzyme family)
MINIFDPVSLGSVTLRNRFVRSATWEGMADSQGYVTDELIDLMRRLAEGKVGLIITGHAYVSNEGQAHHHQLAITQDQYIENLSEMTQVVHKAGGKIFLQLAHAGFRADSQLTKILPVGPTEIYEEGPQPIARALTVVEIQDLVEAFGKAARRAQRAGFDGVQVHGGHGYLFNQFLAPIFNRRADAYGGQLDQRARFLYETLQSIRNKVGSDYPVMLKINSEDYLENGFTIEEMLKVSQKLEVEGTVDAIEMSGGNSYRGLARFAPVRNGKIRPDQEAWYKASAVRYKSKISIPLILVGGIRSLDVACRLVSDQIADYISMSRPFITEPDLIQRWEAGDLNPSRCVSDTLCFKKLLEGEKLRCHVFPSKP